MVNKRRGQLTRNLELQGLGRSMEGWGEPDTKPQGRGGQKS